MTQSFRICIADDHAVFRKTLRRLLAEDENLEVAGEAANGLALVELVERTSPDLVITDWSMPVMGGLEATQTLRQRGSAVKVLVLSLHAASEYAAAAQAAGAQGYLQKSAGSDQILKAIRSLLAGNEHWPEDF